MLATSAKVSLGGHTVGDRGGSHMWFPFIQEIVTEHWASTENTAGNKTDVDPDPMGLTV